MSGTVTDTTKTDLAEAKDIYEIDIIDQNAKGEPSNESEVPPLGFNIYMIFAGVLFTKIFSSLLTSAFYPLETFIVSQLASFDLYAIPVIVSTLVNIFFLPFFGKTSDLFGRMPILICIVAISAIGYLITGFSQNFIQYSIGSIIQKIGEVGESIIVPVLLADLLIARNRGLGFVIYWIPNFVAIFAALPIIEPIKESGWRNLFFILSGGLVATSIPLFIGLYRQRNLMIKPKAKFPLNILKEIDTVGLILLTTGLGLILIPFSIVTREPLGWASPTIITMLVVGVFVLGVFAFWEFRYNKFPLMPKRLFENKALIVLMMTNLLLSIDASINWAYFTSYLIVSRDITETHAAILNRGFQVSWYLVGFIIGYLIKRFGWTRSILWIGCCFNLIGMALTIPARHPTSSDALVITAEAFMGAGTGMFECVFIVMTQSLVQYKDIATITYVIALLNQVFKSIASAVATSVWNSSLNRNLIHYLPTEYLEQVPGLLSDLYSLRELPLEVKPLWVNALSDTQLIMSAISISIACLAALTSIFIKPLDLN